MNPLQRDRLYEAFKDIAAVTNGNDWNTGSEEGTLDPSKMATAIPPARWLKAFKVAIDMSDTLPHLPVPVPAADPAGHTWLEYERDGAFFKLAIQRDAFMVVRRTACLETTHAMANLGEVADALSATFARVRL